MHCEAEVVLIGWAIYEDYNISNVIDPGGISLADNFLDPINETFNDDNSTTDITNTTQTGILYHIPNEWIYVNNDESDTWPRDCQSDTELLKHEMIHHLLHLNGLGEYSGIHAPGYFRWECITELGN